MTTFGAETRLPASLERLFNRNMLYKDLKLFAFENSRAQVLVYWLPIIMVSAVLKEIHQVIFCVYRFLLMEPSDWCFIWGTKGQLQELWWLHFQRRAAK